VRRAEETEMWKNGKEIVDKENVVEDKKSINYVKKRHEKLRYEMSHFLLNFKCPFTLVLLYPNTLFII
jgi:hypothetical protein